MISIRYSQNAKKDKCRNFRSNFGVKPIKNACGKPETVWTLAGDIHPVKRQLGNTMIIGMIVSASFKSWYGK